jgi:hypothetical protein
MHTKSAWFVGLVLLFAPTSRGQAPHPRIWLDSARLSQLTVLKQSNDPTWIALKADADAYLTQSVLPYDRSVCATNQICYTYEGGGWYKALSKLSLAYKMTGKTAYSNKVKDIVTVMIAAGVAPVQVDSGFPTRFISLGLALAYDWCYDQLSSTDKSQWTALAEVYWNYINANGYQWNIAAGGRPNPYGNYFGGHILGLGTLALAIEGDDSNSPAMQAAILNNFNTYVPNAFAGGYLGGYALESYNYGGNHFLRLFQYMDAMRTAGKTDLLNTNMSWLKQVAKNTLYQERPDRWSVTDEGGWTGSYIRTLYRNFVYDLAGLMKGTTEGGWLVYLYNNMTTPTNGAPASLYMPTSFELLLYKTDQPPIDYTATQATYIFSPGDQHSIARTDWSTTAVHTTFNGGTLIYADHQSHSAGHISIQRGPDYLLINAGEWAGQTGNSGNPQADDIANWHKNTLFYWDQNAACLDQTMSGGQYAGCQMFWPTANTTKHKETSDIVFQEADLRPAYLNNQNISTITSYTRSFVNIKDIDFVFDRISAPATSIRNLEWHTPALKTATPAGVATAMSVHGPIASATVGASTIWIKTLLPAAPLVNTVTDTASWVRATPMTSQRFEVSDVNAAGCSNNCLFLTVLAPTASNILDMPPTTIINAGEYQGAIYDDGRVPRIAMFSIDAITHNSLIYTATYDATLKGIHTVTDLTTGTYDVTKDNASVYSGLVVGPDGCLSFTTLGGGTYRVQNTGPNALLPPSGLALTVQ